ncbi:MAG TPA: VWA domain-containing protein [Kofleriaceae bacterium]|nr:VWA domain-containing protein [Kofleriaceae bacterium]
MRPLYSLALLAAACGSTKHPVLEPPPPPPPAVVAASDPQLVTMVAAFGNKYTMADQDGDVFARLRIDTRDLPSAERPPLRVVLAMDTSGSMEGEAIDRARAAAMSILGELENGDELAAVVFHSRTEVLVPMTKVTAANRDDIRAKLEAIQATGTTDMSGGLSAAMAQATAGFDPQHINRIVLLSDGIPNDPTPILGQAQAAASYAIPITTLGMGLEYDETLMGAIAKASGGTFHQIKNNDEVIAAFKNEVLRMKRLVARQMVLQLQPGPGVTIQGVVGLNPQASGRGVYVTLGDLSQGERRDVLVKLHVKGHRPDARVELADAILTFQDAVQNAGSLSRSLFLSVLATADKKKLEEGKDSDVEKAAARAELSEAVLSAIAFARAGAVDQARMVLDAAEPRARAAFRAGGDETLGKQLGELAPLRRALPNLAPPPPPPVVVAGKPQATPPPQPRPETPEDAKAVRDAHEEAMKPSQPMPSNAP